MLWVETREGIPLARVFRAPPALGDSRRQAGLVLGVVPLSEAFELLRPTAFGVRWGRAWAGLRKASSSERAERAASVAPQDVA